MNQKQIAEVIDLIKTGAVPADWSDDLTAQVIRHLRPLDHHWAMLRAQDWVGRATPGRFLNTLPDVLAAVGVPAGARPDLVRAAHTPGAQLIPDLRSPTELTYVGPDEVIPRGAVEYLRHNHLPEPPQPGLPLKVLPQPIGDAPPPPLRRLGEMAQHFRALQPPKPPPKPVRRYPDVQSYRDMEDLLAARSDLDPAAKEIHLRLAREQAAQIRAAREAAQHYEEQLREMREENERGAHP